MVPVKNGVEDSAISDFVFNNDVYVLGEVEFAPDCYT